MIVLIAVTEKVVMLTDQFNTRQISGRQSIFARVDAPTEVKPVVEIVGAYSTLDLCNRARAAHFASHPQCRYLQKICRLDIDTLEPQPAKCIDCGIPTNGGVVFCPVCQKRRWDMANGLDPRGGEGDPHPVTQTTFGPSSELRNVGA